MLNKKIITIFVGLMFFAPSAALALTMPQSTTDLAGMADLNAHSYAVVNNATGEIILAKNADSPWPPASLTKLVTALVVLDTKPSLGKTVAITKQDQTVGACSGGGACIKAKSGVKFTVDGLFHAALMPSANNAANALARSTGLSQKEFVRRMNLKASKLGATHTHFNEPTGMDPKNTTTAGDYAKIVVAAFANPYLRQVAGQSSYTLRSTNNRSYTQVIKNTDKLLSDAEVQILGAKTGYLDEAKYNFASLLKYRDGRQLAVVVLGEQHLYSAFSETKMLAALARMSEELALQNGGQVLGSPTTP